MTDQEKREKVIGSLETAVKNFERYSGDEYGREYDYARVEVETLEDALALLKAHEPKPVHVTAEINHRKIGECPNCGKPINSGDYPNYCGHCGQAVKWDGQA